MQNKASYPYLIDCSLVDNSGVVTPIGYQKMIILTTEKELKRINLSISQMTEKYGVTWILLSLTVKVLKPILSGQEVVVTTWHTNKKGVIFRREFEITSQEGEVLVRGATFSSLIDLNKRRICMDRAVYDDLNLEEGEETFEAQSKSAITSQFDFCEEVFVRPSWIDALDHVNNFKYAELAFDNIPSEYLKRGKDITKIEIFFTGELRFGESVKVFKNVQNSTVQIKGDHSLNQKPAFLYKIHYSQ